MFSSSVRCIARLFLALLLLAPAAHTIAAEPIDGKWQLNAAKSRFSPGPPLKSQSRTYSTDKGTQSVVIETIDAKGEANNTRTAYRLDGQDYPVRGSAEIDTIAMKKVNDHTARGTGKRAGKPVFTLEREVSSDGKTLTVTTKGTSPDGGAMHNVLVFERM